MPFNLTTIREIFKCANCPPCKWKNENENDIRVTRSKGENQKAEGEPEPTRYFPHNSIKSEDNRTPQPLPLTPPTTTTEENLSVYKALWSFEARAEEELSFGKDDLLRVTERCGDWWKADKLVNGQVVASGVVPYNYLVKGETLEAQP